jgi:hypothetical protein
VSNWSCYLADVSSAQVRYSVRRLRRKAPAAFILIILAGAANFDMKAVFSASERVDFVQQSLGEAVARVLAIAAGSSKPDELASASSPPLSVAANSRSLPERRAI